MSATAPKLPSGWSAALERAVRSAVPGFFDLPEAERLRRRVSLKPEEREELETRLLCELGLDAPRDAYGDLRLAPVAQEQINRELLPFQGIGEDSFFLNDGLGEGRSILDFSTLAAYDRAMHAFQEEAEQQMSPGHVARPYRGRLRATWARVLVEGELVYLTLDMAAGVIASEAEQAAEEEVRRLVPYRYVEGPRHGLKTGCGEFVEHDMLIDAGGREGLVEQLHQQIWTEAGLRRERLSAQWDALGRKGCYIRDVAGRDPVSNSKEWHIVFTDAAALESVRFTSFLQDSRAIERPIGELDEAIELEVRSACSGVVRRHAEVG